MMMMMPDRGLCGGLLDATFGLQYPSTGLNNNIIILLVIMKILEDNNNNNGNDNDDAKCLYFILI